MYQFAIFKIKRIHFWYNKWRNKWILRKLLICVNFWIVLFWYLTLFKSTAIIILPVSISQYQSNLCMPFSIALLAFMIWWQRQHTIDQFLWTEGNKPVCSLQYGQKNEKETKDRRSDTVFNLNAIFLRITIQLQKPLKMFSPLTKKSKLWQLLRQSWIRNHRCLTLATFAPDTKYIDTKTIPEFQF